MSSELKEKADKLHDAAKEDIALRFLNGKEPGNLLKEADALTGGAGERREAYDHPSVDFGCTAALWTAVLRRAGLLSGEQQITAELVPVMMAVMKISRLSGNLHHRDSALDIAGYMRTLEMVWQNDG